MNYYTMKYAQKNGKAHTKYFQYMNKKRLLLTENKKVLSLMFL